MKQLTEMSWEELLKLREDIRQELGEDQDPSLAEDLDSGPHEWVEADLIEALAALPKIKEAAPSAKKDAPKSPPKGYPTSKGDYADPTNYKYPLDTEKHVRAALSYFSKPENRSKGGYSAEEQKFMWKRIIAAAKKFGIELSGDVKKHAEAIGNSNSDGGEVNEEMNEKEITELIHKALKEQMPTSNTGQAPNTMEAQGVTVRVPPEIEAINTQLENFKQMHAKHEAANKDMSDKVAALTKQVSDMNEAFQKMTKQTQAVADDGKTTEAEAAKSTKPPETAKGAKGASENEDADSDSDSEDSDSEDSDSEEGTQQEKVKDAKKVKEQAQQAHAEGLVATSDMSEGNGVNPPGFAAPSDDKEPRSFGDVMNRATRQRRRGIGGN